MADWLIEGYIRLTKAVATTAERFHELNDALLQSQFTVKCAEHGGMKYRCPQDWWNCVGFDGEGCPAVLTAYDLRLMLEQIDNPPGDVDVVVYPDGSPYRWRTDGGQ